MTRDVFGGIGGALLEDEDAADEDEEADATEATEVELDPLATDGCRGGRRGRFGGMSDIAKRWNWRSLGTCNQALSRGVTLGWMGRERSPVVIGPAWLQSSRQISLSGAERADVGWTGWVGWVGSPRRSRGTIEVEVVRDGDNLAGQARPAGLWRLLVDDAAYAATIRSIGWAGGCIQSWLGGGTITTADARVSDHNDVWARGLAGMLSRRQPRVRRVGCS